MLIIGIDPGLTGAIAWFWPVTGDILIYGMPTLTKTVNKKQRTIIDEVALAGCLGDPKYRPNLAIVEEVGGIPGQSAPRAFSFGYGAGLIRMALVAQKIPVTNIRPQDWKSALRAPKDKVAYTARACELMPWAADHINAVGDKDKRSGRAAAAMLAFYGARLEGFA